MEVQFTPGPWQWQVNERCQDVRLVALHSGIPYVMDFVRWGMNHAQPRFRVDMFMQNGRELTSIVPGREHHSNWFKALRHPDAQLIETAPVLFAALAELLHLHSCEQEGLSSGQPTREQWLEAVDKGREAIEKATTVNP